MCVCVCVVKKTDNVQSRFLSAIGPLVTHALVHMIYINYLLSALIYVLPFINHSHSKV